MVVRDAPMGKSNQSTAGYIRGALHGINMYHTYCARSSPSSLFFFQATRVPNMIVSYSVINFPELPNDDPSLP